MSEAKDTKIRIGELPERRPQVIDNRVIRPVLGYLHKVLRALIDPRLRLVYLALLALPFVVLYIHASVISPIQNGMPFDFAVYLRASEILAGGGNPYSLSKNPHAPAVLAGNYIYPPFWAWILQPLVHLDPGMQVALFIAHGQHCMGVFIWSVVRALDIRSLQDVLLVIISILGFQPVIGGYLIGQVSIVLLPLAGLWLLAWRRDRGWGHLVLGLAIGIKVIQAPVLLMTLVWRRFTWLALAVVGMITTALVAVPRYVLQYLSEVFPALRTTSDIRNQSVSGILTRALHPGTFWPTEEADHSYLDVTIISMVLSLALVVVSAWALWQMPTGKRGRLYGAALVSTIAPLLAPVVWGDHQVFLVIPLLVLSYYALVERRLVTLLLAVAVWIMIDLGIPVATALVLSKDHSAVLVDAMVALPTVATLLLWAIALFECRRITNVATLRPPVVEAVEA